jgi:SAM-dependent methyltransferase
MTILLFHIKESRIKAIDLAIFEAFALLKGLNVEYLKSGPESDKRGTFCLQIQDDKLEQALERFEHLGYCNQVEEVIIEPSSKGKKNKRRSTWKGNYYRLEELYKEDAKKMRKKDPDQREFILLDLNTGEEKRVSGYRGSGEELTKRALPVSDSRLLLNITYPKKGDKFLDPFAGAGGIVIEAVDRGLKVSSSDIDPILTPGLKNFGADHYVSSIEKLPFQNNYFDVIATEIPFSKKVTELVVKGMEEMKRVLRDDGRISIMTSEDQAEAIRNKAKGLKLKNYLDKSIDRKGTLVHIFTWIK